jgi:hypothetical protein
MADNVTVDNGALADYQVSTDEAASGHVSRVKLAYSANGSDTHVQADADGVLVNLGANNDVTVTGAVTANAGTNLNTSALAVESGGNLAAATTALQVMDDWDESDRAKVNPIAGQAGVAAGAGTISATTQRVTPACDATWIVSTGNTIHVAAARTTLFDLFNASGSGVVLRVRAIHIIPALAAVTGVGQTYEIIRTSAVGTGGSTRTPEAYDDSSAALPAQVTARTKPTGGATTSATLIYVNGSSEETNPYAAMASQLNHIAGAKQDGVEPLVLREGQGLKIDQTTSSSVGNVNVVVVFNRSAS